jgi:pimeloyl-ACP methyl ester carboxylesterase
MHTTAIFEPDSKLGHGVQRPVDLIASRRQGLSKQNPIEFARAKRPENAYALDQQPTSSLHLITCPQAGHGPHHEHPELSADVIANFVRNI